MFLKILVINNCFEKTILVTVSLLKIQFRNISVNG